MKVNILIVVISQRISLTPEEKTFHMNLEPFINQSHYVVLEVSLCYIDCRHIYKSLVIWTSCYSLNCKLVISRSNGLVFGPWTLTITNKIRQLDSPQPIFLFFMIMKSANKIFSNMNDNLYICNHSLFSSKKYLLNPPECLLLQHLQKVPVSGPPAHGRHQLPQSGHRHCDTERLGEIRD